jgi:hypothetical protein
LRQRMFVCGHVLMIFSIRRKAFLFLLTKTILCMVGFGGENLTPQS